MRLGIAEILKEAGEKPTRQERIDHLRKNWHESLGVAVWLAFAPGLEWDLPKGWRPDYRPSIYHDQESALYQALRKVGKFLVDGYQGLDQERKMVLFVQLLESITPLDAELMIGLKNGRMPFRGITRSLAKEAFPHLDLGGTDESAA